MYRAPWCTVEIGLDDLDSVGFGCLKDYTHTRFRGILTNKGSIPLARSRSENEKAPSAMTGLFRFWLLGLDRKGLRWERWHFAVRQKRHLKGK